MTANQNARLAASAPLTPTITPVASLDAHTLARRMPERLLEEIRARLDDGMLTHGQFQPSFLRE